MGRGHYHPKECKVCGKKSWEGHHISQKGYCIDCAMTRSVTQITSMVMSNGVDFQEWRRAVARSIGAVLPDDQ